MSKVNRSQRAGTIKMKQQRRKKIALLKSLFANLMGVE
jgi:hypothetical protein